VKLAWVCRHGASEVVAALAAAVIAVAAVFCLYACSRELHKMNVDRRFTIVVSLIWAVLVTGAFYLMAGILPAAAPSPDRQLRRELERTNHILTRRVVVSACARVRNSP
jgi:uncharacterized membrane protein